MQRILGVTFIMLGCVGLALAENKKQRDHVGILYLMGRIINDIRGQMESSRKTLPEIFMEECKWVPKEFSEGFHRIVEEERRGTGEEFSSIFRKEMEKVLVGEGVAKEEMEPFLAIFDGTDSEFLDTRMTELDQCRKRMLSIADEVHRGYQKKKLFTTRLSVMGGFLLILFLL